jgi:hypothetical protein
METIKLGSKGVQVERWQFFLAGFAAYSYIKADGKFGPNTHRATVDFQQKSGLHDDGVVGENTYLAAFRAGYNNVEAREYPGKPDFPPLVSNGQRQKVFGKFKYRRASPNSDDIVVTDDWAKKNIVLVEIPQLVGVKGAPASGKITFHKLAQKQLLNLFNDWEKESLIPLIKTWNGSYVPRFVRGRPGVLSNHSFGSAFDVNYAWNMLGREPALVGQPGSVRELVKIANKHGFYWGGHFKRLDGMHFEVARVL